MHVENKEMHEEGTCSVALVLYVIPCLEEILFSKLWKSSCGLGGGDEETCIGVKCSELQPHYKMVVYSMLHEFSWNSPYFLLIKPSL